MIVAKLLLIQLPLLLSRVAALVLPQNILPTAFGVVFALTSPTTTQLPPSETSISQYGSTIPVLEVVKIYGKLAGNECYGKQAPKGSSCQIKLNDVQRTLYDDEIASSSSSSPSSSSGSAKVVSRDDFATKLQGMEFSWPLKPFGVDGSPSLVKTAVMNKGAETRVFMEELEARKLYDPRNPTGPLPTSLRPALNRHLQAEGVLDRKAIDRAYDALVGWSQSNAEPAPEYIDYYEFLKMFGPNSISWPK